MKATLTFDLPDEVFEHEHALNGWRYHAAIHAFAETLRQHRKYMDLDERFGSPSEYHAHLERLWFECIEDIDL